MWEASLVEWFRNKSIADYEYRRIFAGMSTNYISPRMRQVAPEQCAEIDKLRAGRRPLADRLSYLGATETEETTALKRRIEEIDTKVAGIHALARQRLDIALADGLAEGANKLQKAVQKSDGIVTFHRR